MHFRCTLAVLFIILSHHTAGAEDKITCSGSPQKVGLVQLNIPTHRQRELVIMAIAQAQKAIRLGNPPFGSILVDIEGTQKWWAHNVVRSAKDPLGHAEMEAIKGASFHYGQGHFRWHGLVTNSEPCGMCAQAAIKAGISFFIYGAPAESHTKPRLTLKDVIARSREEIAVIEGFFADEVLKQIREGRAALGQR